MNFYEELKRLCKIRGLTVEVLLKMIGKPGITTFSGWKQRGCYPRADDLYKICKILEVSMEHFFGDEEGIVVNKTKMDFINKLDYLSDDDFQTLNNLSEAQLKNLITLAKSMQS